MGSKTTRVDFYRINVNGQIPNAPVHWGYLVRFYIQGWDFYTTPYRTEIDPPTRDADGREQPFDLSVALETLEDAGWTVRRWATGARAWRGPAMPVRTREQIIGMRRRQSRRLAESHGQPEPEFTTFIDYAYEG